MDKQTPDKIERLLRQDSSEGSLIPLPPPLQISRKNPDLKKSYSEDTLPRNDQASNDQEPLQPLPANRWRCTLL